MTGPSTSSGSVTKINRTAVIGSGHMGRGIALSLLRAECDVTLFDTAPGRAEEAVAWIVSELERQRDKGTVTAETVAHMTRRLNSAATLEEFANVDLVVEAIVENLDAKRSLFANLDQIVQPGALLATNTSTLDVNAIAAVTARPAQVLGVHFFSPAHVQKLVEVIDARETSPGTLASALDLVSRMGKTAVVAQVGFGFIGNRIFDAYLLAALGCALEGTSPQDIDCALENFGFKMGPFRVMDLVGLDVMWHIRREAGDAAEPGWALLGDVVARGDLGNKTGAGWYAHGADRTFSERSEISELLATAQKNVGGEVHALAPDEIVARCVGALAVEGERVVDEGIAASADDVDTVFVLGYGFPADKGGPMAYGRSAGLI
jgi:3-hydroxyacyl-CoA dehydrogenase